MRAEQNKNMLYHCLVDSLFKVAKAKVSIRNSQYKVNRITVGNLLLKFIIREIHIDTNASMASIRTQLRSLDAYIGTIGCNITKFNAYIKLLLAGLSARGETSHDMLTNLFQGCKAESDSVFFQLQ